MKAVNNAIREYERAATQPNLFKVKNAFEDWKRFKGPHWRNSDHNRAPAFAITRLEDQLKLVADTGLYRLTHGWSLEELRALRYMGEERKKVIVRIFEGKEVAFRNSPQGVKQAAKDAGEKVRQSCSQAQSWLHGANKKGGLSTEEKIEEKLEEMVKKNFSVDRLEQIVGLSGLILDILAKCSRWSSRQWVVSHIEAGADLFTGWAKAGAALHKQHSMSDCAYHIDTGAPTAAFHGLEKYLIEETKKETTKRPVATTSIRAQDRTGFARTAAPSGASRRRGERDGLAGPAAHTWRRSTRRRRRSTRPCPRAISTSGCSKPIP